MAKIPKLSVEQQILLAMEDGNIEQEHREYLGYSSLGGKCKRAIWYNFRWILKPTISRRIDRLYKRGNWEEHRIVKDLANAGINFHSDQLEIVGFDSHIKGHIDGLLNNVPGFFDEELLVEFKTANEKNFKLFQKIGCKKANQQYYYQAQSYMGRLNLKNCLFIVTNKNDECRYIEIIPFDIDEYKLIEIVAKEILMTDIPPDKIGGPTWYDCKFCNFYQICHYNKNIDENCRNCNCGAIELNGEWTCEKFGNILNKKEQEAGCKNYKKLETLNVN